MAIISSIFAFLSGEMGLLILGGLLALSEYLGTTDRFKSSSVIQAATSGLKWIIEKAKSLKPAPKV